MIYFGIIYLIGVIIGLVMIFIANLNTPIKTWKKRLVIKYCLYTLGSWLFLAYVLYCYINDDWI